LSFFTFSVLILTKCCEILRLQIQQYRSNFSGLIDSFLTEHSVLYQVATEANVNVEEELTVAMYNNSCALKSDSNMSLTSSVYSVEHGPNSVGRRKTAVRGASRRTSLQLVKQAFVRGTAGCLFRPLKSDVDDEYAYGIPEVSNESSPEVTRTNSQLLTLSKRYKRHQHIA